MKRIIEAYLFSVLSNFKCYRKRIAGKWYKIRQPEAGGLAAGTESWVQDLPVADVYTIIKKEEY
jgi:hypothetical protein